MPDMRNGVARRILLIGMSFILIAGFSIGSAGFSTESRRQARTIASSTPHTPRASEGGDASTVRAAHATSVPHAAAAPVNQAEPPATSSSLPDPPAAATAVTAPPPPLAHRALSELGIAAANTVSLAIASDPNYAGAWIDGANIVHIATAGDPTMIAEIAANSGLKTAVETRGTARHRLIEVRNAIAARAFELAGYGLSLVAVGIADAANAVRLTAVISNPTAADQLRSQYPDVAIEVHAILDGAVAVRGAPRSASSLGVRGGVVISPAARPSFRCVAGFAVTTPRGTGITTAGHCGRAGEAFLLGNGPGTVALGSVSARVNDEANVHAWPGQRVTTADMEVIGTPDASSTVIFDDRTLPVRGMLPKAVVGQLVYASLGRTGTTSPGRVTEVDVVTIGTPNGEMPTTTDNIGISQCANAGDSGSPVVVAESVSVRALGLVIATPDAQCSLDPLAPEHESETYVSLIGPSLHALGAQLAEERAIHN